MSLFLTAAVTWAMGRVSVAQPATPKPRLVVVFSIDQFRADYLSRFAENFLPPMQGTSPGGFRWLCEKGAWYTEAHHTHIPTATGPGHAAISTGTGPAVHGIIGNGWYDRATNKEVYCVEDPNAKTIGGPSDPMSPRLLTADTVGDELKLASQKSQVVGLAFKDRASILMAGHAADEVVWFDTLNGAWVTSDFYAKDGKLSQWAAETNAQSLPDKGVDQIWTPLLPDSAYANTRLAPFAKPNPGGPIFSHKTDGTGKNKFRNWTTSGFGQQYVFDSAKKMVLARKLGADTNPDIFWINLSTNDYVGHAYGPNSPEVADITYRTDRLLADFFGFLQKTVPGGLNSVTIAITADHGVVPIPEESQKLGIPGIRIPDGALQKGVDAALDEKFGAGDWVAAFDEPNLYLNEKTIADMKVDPAAARTAAARAAEKVTGIFRAVTVEEIRGKIGNLPGDLWGNIHRSFQPERSGDIMVFEKPFAYFGGGFGTGHGSPWAYDSHVPILLAGAGVKPGKYARRVSVMDIAPTLSNLLGIEQPGGCIGVPLREAIGQ